MLSSFQNTLSYLFPSKKYTPVETQEYILSLSPDEYVVFLILTHSLEVFTLRGIKEKPRFNQRQNLYSFDTPQLQVLYHRTKDLEESMLNKECARFLFIESKVFQKQNRAWEKKFDIARINQRHMCVPLLDKFITKIEVKRDVEFYSSVNVDNKFPITLVSDPQVALLGAHKGDVLIYHRISQDTLPCEIIEIQYVDSSQSRSVQMTFEGSEDGMLNDGLEQGDDEDEKKNHKDIVVSEESDAESDAESYVSNEEDDDADADADADVVEDTEA